MFHYEDIERFNQVRFGWITPNLRIISCGFTSHLQYLIEEVEEFKFSYKEQLSQFKGSKFGSEYTRYVDKIREIIIKQAFEKGWYRISIYDNILYIEGEIINNKILNMKFEYLAGMLGVVLDIKKIAR